jgi:ParB-like chromosome segregation protein Spo0J
MATTAFPPILVTTDKFIVDGNTRVAACQKRKDNFFPAAVLEASYAHASDQERAQIHALAATLNQKGGQRIKPSEMRKVTEDLLDLGWNADNVSRAIGASVSTISQVRREREGFKRLEHLGFDPSQFDQSSHRVLGSVDAMALNDEPYRQLAKLTLDAGLQIKEVIELARAMKATGSDQAGIEVARKLREEQASRIRARALTGKGKPPPSSLVKRALGLVLKYRPTEIVEHNEAAMRAYRDVLDKAVEILSETIELQDEAIDKAQATAAPDPFGPTAGAEARADA